MTDASGLRLMAHDADDLHVIAAATQDAIVRPSQIRFEPKARRFIAPLVRFRWEVAHGGDWRRPTFERVRAALQFDGVLAARYRGVPITDAQALRPLLTIAFDPEPGEPDGPGGRVRLVFGGGGEAALDVECVDALLMDVSPPWRTRRRPSHD